MDKVGADFDMCIDSMRERLGANPVAIQFPLGAEETFRGICDLVKMRAAVFDEESLGQKFEWIEIPADILPRCLELRDQLLEACADVSDGVMEKFVAGELDSITEDEIHAALRKGTIAFKLVPVLCGSAFKNKGVQLLLDAVVSYLPSPLDVPAIEGHHPTKDKMVTRHASDEEPFAALAFKIMNEPHGT
jgi:elongation factor G